MLLAVLTYLVVTAATDAANCTHCIRAGNDSCYSISFIQNLDAKFREKVVIKKMGVLHKENTLFYSYEPAITDPEFYKIAYLNLDQPEDNGTIYDPNTPVHNFGTFDIDQEKSLLYLGGRDGIFTYGPSKKVAWYSSLGDEILTLYFKDNLYIVKANDSRIIVKKGDTFNSALEEMPIKNFVVTKDNVIVFLGTYGLFLSKDGETVWLSKNAFFRGFDVDLDGVVYTWWIDEIFRIEINKANIFESRLVRFATIHHLVALTFDNKNNILFTVGRGLHRMAITGQTEC